MKNSKSLILTGLFLAGLLGATAGWAVDDPRVKVLMQEALQLYSERRYVKAKDLFNQVLRIDPSNNLAKQYLKSTEERITEWDAQGGEYQSGGEHVTWDALLDSKSQAGMGERENAKEIIATRKSLVERMQSRSVKTDNIVRIEDTKKGLEVILYHDQLFLPGLQTLRDESLPILENVANLMKERGDRMITIYSMSRHDSTDPFLLFPDFPVPAPDPTQNLKSAAPKSGSSFLFQDLEATRSYILFTYLAQRSMGQSSVSAQR
jgi:tetratricopeptide (TPR) repeat protein